MRQKHLSQKKDEREKMNLKLKSDEEKERSWTQRKNLERRKMNWRKRKEYQLEVVI